MAKPKATVAGTLARQYEFAFKMLRAALEQCPPKRWAVARDPFFAPGRLALHILSSTQRYCRRPGARVRPPSWAGREVPTKAQVLEYLNLVEQQVQKWLGGLTDSQLLASDSGFKWTGENRLARALYTLRHIHHHLGQINAELRVAGYKPAAWLVRTDLPAGSS